MTAKFEVGLFGDLLICHGKDAHLVAKILREADIQPSHLSPTLAAAAGSIRTPCGWWAKTLLNCAP